MADRDTMVHKRGRIKAKITRIEHFVTANDDNLLIDSNEFVIRETMLVKAYEEYENIQDQLEEIDGSQESDRVEVELQYTSLHSNLKTTISKRLNSEQQGGGESSNVADNSGPSASSSSKVKLPNINIPTFSGKYEEYNSFIELFDSLINCDKHLNKIQRIICLKSGLKDEPLVVSKALQTTESHYDVALEILISYNKPPHSHIRNLLEAQFLKGASPSL
uniref:Uncharacterized protein n=1 Tax=Photinus pyralis TaxID=7054 RepID=A0A1Y1MLN8_PHOPY